MADELSLKLELVTVVGHEECSFEVEVSLHLRSDQVPSVLSKRLKQVQTLIALQHLLSLSRL